MQNAGLDESQAGGKTAERNINSQRYIDDTTLIAERKKELKSLLMKVKECERAGLETQHPKTKIIAYSLINSWQIDGKKMEAVTDFIVLGSKMTADVDCRHEIKRRLLLRRKPMTNLGSILKSRDITLLTKVCEVKATVFSSSHGGI